jgi:hypothetical protein
MVLINKETTPSSAGQRLTQEIEGAFELGECGSYSGPIKSWEWSRTLGVTTLASTLFPVGLSNLQSEWMDLLWDRV